MSFVNTNIDPNQAFSAANGNIIEIREDRIAGVDREWIVSTFNDYLRPEEVLIIKAP